MVVVKRYIDLAEADLYMHLHGWSAGDRRRAGGGSQVGP